MIRMREPYTGVIFEVAPSKVAARLASGWSLIDGEIAPTAIEDADADPKPEQRSEDAKADEPKPGADSTIAEIRAWAKANGVELPKKGNKAAMLAAIE